MSDPKTPSTEIAADDPREPYEAPRLECEELFEVLALACGKVQGVSHSCNMGRNRAS
jgi:hypothetical protein